MSLAADRVSWGPRGRLVVDGVSLAVAPGGVTGLLGPNGSGKSSLLRLLAGLRRPSAGAVTLGGADLAAQPRAAVARRLAFVEQHAVTQAAVTVRDVVRLGRTPHRGLLAPWSAADEAAVEAALRSCDLLPYVDQPWQSLSGGERQRAQIARALAQCPKELLLDEPTNHLDIRHQLEILTLLRGLPATCLVALHDLNLAGLFCDGIVLLQAGRVVSAGPPAAVLTVERIAAVFGVEAAVERDGDRVRVRYLP